MGKCRNGIQTNLNYFKISCDCFIKSVTIGTGILIYKDTYFTSSTNNKNTILVNKEKTTFDKIKAQIAIEIKKKQYG
ncbi:MAG: hypothetical protein AAF688_01175 [Bacteroidota bacterium]